MPTATPSASPQPIPSTTLTKAPFATSGYDITRSHSLGPTYRTAGRPHSLRAGAAATEATRGRNHRGRAGQCGQVGRTVTVPGVARLEPQSVRYAARSQPLDWLSDRHDQNEHCCGEHRSPRHHRRPGRLRPPITRGVPACASSRSWLTGGAGRTITHGGTRVWFGLDDMADHDPARDLAVHRIGASGGSIADCRTPREFRHGEQQQVPAAGGWYADQCTDWPSRVSP
jgi:hypothetical protein